MNTRFLATVSALTLIVSAGAAARAGETETKLAWQEPGYVMEVVIATARRPVQPASAAVIAATATASAGDVELAWKQPGYVEEVVVVKASRSEILAAAGRPGLPARPPWPYFGAPAK